MTCNAENAHRLFSAFVLTVSLAGASHTNAFAAQPVVIPGTENASVWVNLPTSKSDTKYTAPQQVVDGSDVIILIPPSLQKKVPARVKPEFSLPETAAEAAQVKRHVASDAMTKMATIDAASKPEETTPLPPQAEVNEKQPEPEEIAAALTPEKKPDPLPIKRATGDMTRILFPAGEATLPGYTKAEIQAPGQNVQLIAYATGDSNSAARRLSLDRALSARSKLMDLSVKNNKIEVRALGQPTGDGPVDRVNLVMIARGQ